MSGDSFDVKTIAVISVGVLAVSLLTVGIYNLTRQKNNKNKKVKKEKEREKEKDRENGKGKGREKGKEKGSDSESDDSFKGYKKTSTGQTTTYFHREISHEEKQLLGDLTPKRIDGTTITSTSPQTITGSAWNSAGTYEEKNVSDWTQQTLRKKISNVIHQIPSNGQVVVTNISKIEGDSTVSVIRGKKRYLYDISITLDWKVEYFLSSFFFTVWN